MKKFYIPQQFEGFTNFLKRIKVPYRVIFITAGILSTLWFLFRVIPKPSRATYPCMKAAAPLASSFITYLIGITGFTLFFRKARERLIQSKFLMAGIFVLLGVSAATLAIISNDNATWAMTLAEKQNGNEPMGVAKGTIPGRVVWMHDVNATNENWEHSGGNYWNSDANTNMEVVDKMVSEGLLAMTGAMSESAAWDSIFKYYNRAHGGGNVGYTPGEKIVIKTNMNANASNGNINTSPQVHYAILDQLINVAGVAQSDISIGDPNCAMDNATYSKLHGAFPNVTYWRANGAGAPTKTSADVIFGSDGSFENPLPQAYLDAKYMINIPVLKKHHRAGISLSSKNHFGSVAPYEGGAWHLHPSLPVPDANGDAADIDNLPTLNYGVYRCFVDIMGHKDLGGKTILYLVDGLWSSVNWGHSPIKWRMKPFDNDWPNSIFLSQDPVAIESVCYDFLFEEFDADHPTEGLSVLDGDKGPFSRFPAADDFLHQSADPANWPAGVNYDPENDGSILTSMGTHEHWNNPDDKQYSRNLGIGDGIELYTIAKLASKITPNNGELLSEKVNAILVDSFNFKWFATDAGLSRFDDVNNEWFSITDTNHILNNNTKDLAYQYSTYDGAQEIWVATDSGVSVLSYVDSIDGITGSTTYTKTDWPILSDTITSVGVDASGTRWIGTPKGISLFWGHEMFDSIKYFLNDDRAEIDLSTVDLVHMASFEEDTSMMYVASQGGGVLRYTRDDVDGVTAASSYEKKWSGMESNVANDFVVIESTQWIASDSGLFRHDGNETKNGWTEYNLIDSGLPTKNITAVEIDGEGNIWLGSDQGIFVRNSLSWYVYGESEGIVNSMVNDIAVDAEGRVWIATDGGVEFFDEVPGINLTPIKQASDIQVLNATEIMLMFGWENGDGTKRVVFMREGTEGTVTPENGETYNAESDFGFGDAIDDWYCVSNGTASSVIVRNLEANKQYMVMVCEYKGEAGSEKYLTKTASGNPAIVATDGGDALKVGIEEQISVYPIPFDEKLTVSVPEHDGQLSMTIFDLRGNALISETLNVDQTSINTSLLQKGAYVLVISDGNIRYSYRIVK